MDPPSSSLWPLVALTVAIPALLLCGLVVLWLLPAGVSGRRRDRWTLFVLWSAALVAGAELAVVLPGSRLLEWVLPASLQETAAWLAGMTQHASGVVTLFRWLPAEGTSLPVPLAVRLQLGVLPLLGSVILLVSTAVCCSDRASAARRSSSPGVLALCLCCVLSLFSVDALPAILFWLAAASCCGIPPVRTESAGTQGRPLDDEGTRITLWCGDLLLVAGGLSLTSGSPAVEWTAPAWLAVVAGVGLRCGLLPCVVWPWQAGGMSATAVARVAAAGVLPVGLILLFRYSTLTGSILSPAVRQLVVWWALSSAAACAVLSARATAPGVLAGCSALTVLCTALAAVAAGTAVSLQAGLLLLLGGGLSLVLAAAVIEWLPVAAGAGQRANHNQRWRTTGGMLLAAWALVVLPGGLCGWNALAIEFRNGQIGPVAWLLPVTRLVLAYSWSRWWFLHTIAGNAEPGERPGGSLPLTQLLLAAALLWLAWGTAAETGPASRLLAAAVASTATGEAAARVTAIRVSTVDADLGLLLVLSGGAAGWFAAVRHKRRPAPHGVRMPSEAARCLATVQVLAGELCRLVAWLDETIPAKLAVLVRRQLPRVRFAVITSLPATPAFSTLAVLLATVTILWAIVLW